MEKCPSFDAVIQVQDVISHGVFGLNPMQFKAQIPLEHKKDQYLICISMPVSISTSFQNLHLSDDIAGATFMAAGSSAPELFTSLFGRHFFHLFLHVFHFKGIYFQEHNFRLVP